MSKNTDIINEAFTEYEKFVARYCLHPNVSKQELASEMHARRNAIINAVLAVHATKKLATINNPLEQLAKQAD